MARRFAVLFLPVAFASLYESWTQRPFQSAHSPTQSPVVLRDDPDPTTTTATTPTPTPPITTTTPTTTTATTTTTTKTTTTNPESCTWCQAGACQQHCSAHRSYFSLSASRDMLQTFPYYVHQDAALRNLQSRRAYPKIELAVLVQHGAGRSGRKALCAMFNGVKGYFGAEFAQNRTVMIAPQVMYEKDIVKEGSLVFWKESTRAWDWGYDSAQSYNKSISLFQVYDEILMAFGEATRFPNLKRVVIFGHSAGGQALQRYAMAGKVHDTLVKRGLVLEYFVANPSSLLYLDNSRPYLATEKHCKTVCVNTTIANRTYRFKHQPSGRATNSTTYNDFGYGLDEGLDDEFPPYMKGYAKSHFRNNYKNRSVTYLAGASDVCNSAFQSDARCLKTFGCSIHDSGVDTSKAAYSQGWCRMERLHAFAQYVRHYYNNASLHRLVSVPEVGHHTCAMIQAPASQRAMFEAIGPSIGPSSGPSSGPFADPSTDTAFSDGSWDDALQELPSNTGPSVDASFTRYDRDQIL